MDTSTTSESLLVAHEGKGDSILMSSVFDAADSVPPPRIAGKEQVDGTAKGFFSALIHVYDTGEENLALKKPYMNTCDPFEFLDLPKKADVAASLDLITPLIMMDVSGTLDDSYFKVIDDSKWLTHIFAMLDAVREIVSKLKTETVLIQNGGPEYDNDGVLSTLVQLCADPYYRTLKGFCVLIEKEWVQYSHSWSENNPPEPGEERVSSLNVQFIYFLHCVYELFQQKPTWFEFGEELLLFLAESVHSQRFGSFFFDYEHVRAQKLPESPVVWQYVLWKENQERFSNASYVEPDQFRVFQLPETFVPAFWGTYFWQHSLVAAQAEKKCQQQIRDSAAHNRTKLMGGGSSGGDNPNLSIASVQITHVKFDSWSHNTFLTVLVLSENRLTMIPPEIGVLVNLTHLVLQRNYISFVSDIIGAKLTKLENLVLSQNRLTGISENIGSLKHLSTINLQRNRLVSLPVHFCDLVLLKVCLLNDNRLTKLPGQFHKLSKLERLELHQNQMVQLPSSHFSTFVSLRSMNLSANKLTHIPDTVSCLTSLHNLDLTYNRLKYLPEGIGGCKSLKILNISNNPELEFIPESFGKLHELESFEASGGSLRHLPFSLGSLRSVTRLMLAKNKLQDIPLSVKHLRNLKDLNLSGNQLTTVSHGIGQCVSLTKLDVSRNEITELPATLSHLHGTLKTFIFENNSIVTPPPEVLEKGASSILGFLKDLLEDSQNIYRVKLMVVGQENVGKTTTITALAKNWVRSGDHELFVAEKKKGNEGQNISTDGIDIGEFTFPYIDPKKKTIELVTKKMKSKAREGPHVRVSIWDFAGQEVYYTTHQFFLSRRSLFLLLFSLTNAASEARVEFWLQSLKTRVPNADIIIVGTHAEDPSLGGPDKLDQRMKELRLKYKKLFPKFVINCMAVSSPENINIVQLRELVQSQMCKQRHMGEQLPSSYLSLEQILLQTQRRMMVPLISVAHLKSVGRMVGHSQPAQTLRAASLLHDMGSLIYFKDEPGLSQMVILNPTWLTQAMATFFTTKHKWVKKGTIQHNDLAQIWKEYPVEIYSSLLYLLQKFEICYELEEDIVEAIMKGLGIFYVVPQAGAATDSLPPKRPEKAPRSTENQSSATDLTTLANERKVELSQGEIAELEAPPFNEFGVSLVPALLPATRPDTEIAKHWKHFPQDGDVVLEQIDRTYTFSFMPKGFFSRLIVKLFPLAHPVSLWASGLLARPAAGSSEDSQDWILVEHLFSENLVEDDQLMESLQLRDNDLSVTVRSEHWTRAQELFTLVIDLVDELAGEWANLRWKRSCVSPNSILRRDSAPEMFSIDDIELMVIKGETVISAETVSKRDENREDIAMMLVMGATSKKTNPELPLHTEFSLSRLCPDIAMANYSGVRVAASELEQGKLVGEGGFALVYLGKYKGGDVALKKLILNVGPDSDATEVSKSFKEFRQEIIIMAALSHPNVVNLLAVSMSPFCLVCEFVPCGNLYDFIHDYEKPISWALRHKISVDLALGIQYMHSLSPPIVHIDMKTPNIMMMSLDVNSPVCAKITDFGTSRFVHRAVTGRFVDNPVWLAPEVLRGLPYGVKVDTYAFGVMAWELLTRESFFGEISFMSDMEDKIVSGERPEIPDGSPSLYVNIIEAGWHQSADQRPEFSWFLDELEDLHTDMKEKPDLYKALDMTQAVANARKLAEEVAKREAEAEKIRAEEARQENLRLEKQMEEERQKKQFNAADEDAFLSFIDTIDEGPSLALRRTMTSTWSMGNLDSIDSGNKWGLKTPSEDDDSPPVSKRSRRGGSVTAGSSANSERKHRSSLSVRSAETSADSEEGQKKSKGGKIRKRSRSRKVPVHNSSGGGDAGSEDSGDISDGSGDELHARSASNDSEVSPASTTKKRSRLQKLKRQEVSLESIVSATGEMKFVAPLIGSTTRMAQPAISLDEANCVLLWFDTRPVGTLLPHYLCSQNKALYLVQFGDLSSLINFIEYHPNILPMVKVVTNLLQEKGGGDKAADTVIKTLRANETCKSVPVIIYNRNPAASSGKHFLNAKGGVFVIDKVEALAAHCT